MEKQILQVGTRGSALARAQVEEIRRKAEALSMPVLLEIQTFVSRGDQDKTRPLDKTTPDDFWTNTLDQALLEKNIDIAIHSAKDVPRTMHPDLDLICLTRSEDETDCFVGRLPLKDLPAGSRIGASSELRHDALRKMYPDLELIPIRGTIEERLAQVDAGKVDGLIVAAIALKRLALTERITEVMPWEATPLQGSLALLARKEQAAEYRKYFQQLDARAAYGSVSLVGAGPGDPELITLKGVNALARADVVFYDYLTHPQLLHHAPRAEKKYVGKRKNHHALSQSALNKKIREQVVLGKRVVRLKGGDPFIFGRGAEEVRYLRAYHIPVEVIAGVSAATGVPAQLGVPLTARDVSSSVSFVSGHGKEESADLARDIQIPETDTIVFFMGLTKLSMIVQGCIRRGWPEDTPVLIVSRGTCWNEKVVQGALKDIERAVEKEALAHPALIIVGKVVDFHQPALSMREQVLYTGTQPQKYAPLGLIVHHPMIQLAQKTLTEKEKEDIFRRISGCAFLILTSPFAVHAFCSQINISEQRRPQILVIGDETARALQDYRLRADFISPVETSRGFVDCVLEHYQWQDQRVLFPRSNLSNPYIKDKLKEAGAIVDELTMYENRKPVKRGLPSTDIRKVVFTSPSTVRHFLEDYQAIPDGWQILAKGETTQAYLKDAGYASTIVSL